MSRIISLIAFIVLIILLLVLFKQCTPKPEITEQNYSTNESTASKGIIQRSGNTTLHSPLNAIKPATALNIPPENNVDEGKPSVKDEKEEKLALSPSEAVSQAAKKAQKETRKTAIDTPYIILQGVNFKFGSAQLSSDSSAQLKKIVARLKNKPKLEVEIAGYADSYENNGVNKDISQLRSEAVKDYILSHGIKADRLIATHYNSSAPVADNSTPEGRSQNRRVEIHVKL